MRAIHEGTCEGDLVLTGVVREQCSEGRQIHGELGNLGLLRGFADGFGGVAGHGQAELPGCVLVWGGEQPVIELRDPVAG